MAAGFLLKGLLLGFSIAAPVGPIGALCIRRTLARGRASGLLSGLGAATADGFYGAVAAFGLTQVSGFLVGQQFWLRIVGGLFLLYLGARTTLSRPTQEARGGGRGSLLTDYVSTFFLTITNPLTVLSFAAIFAGLGLGDPGGDYARAAMMVAGVVLGSSLWWLLLSAGVSLLRSRIGTASLQIINWISGSVILAFAALALAGAWVAAPRP